MRGVPSGTTMDRPPARSPTSGWPEETVTVLLPMIRSCSEFATERGSQCADLTGGLLPASRADEGMVAVHVPDGFIDPPVSLAAGALAAAGVALSLRGTRRDQAGERRR